MQHPHGPARGALCCAGAFVVLLVLGQFGSVGLAGNSYLVPRRSSQCASQPARAARRQQLCGISASPLRRVFVEKPPRSGDTLIPQGLLAGVLLWLGWQAQRIGWNVWGLGIAASCYCLFYLGVVLHRVQHPHGPARGAPCCAGAFVVLLVLGQFGSVGLAGNSSRPQMFQPCAGPPARAARRQQPVGISHAAAQSFAENRRAAAIR